MSNSDAKDSGAGNGATRARVTVVTLTFDHESCLVAVDAPGAHLGLTQMIVDEARRCLDIQRRQAAAFSLQEAVAQAKRDAAIADAVRRKV